MFWSLNLEFEMEIGIVHLYSGFVVKYADLGDARIIKVNVKV